jgi:hypothetical protein
MNQALVDRIAAALLFEGYILYPYRRSIKNRQRWTFGCLYPRGFGDGQPETDGWAMRTECLVAGGVDTALTIQVRFLQLVDRTVGELPQALTEFTEGAEPAYRLVEMLQIGDECYQAWQEAVEREVSLNGISLADLLACPRHQAFAFPAQRHLEAIRHADGELGGVLIRQQQLVEGSVVASAIRAGEGLFRVRVRIRNNMTLGRNHQRKRDEVLMTSLVSTHTILSVRQGEFVSLTDPPAQWREAAAGCRNVGTWPVLVGEDGCKDTMLSSPIILPDYPQVAPESPGDLFDCTEIDEILTLRILALTDDEKRQMTAVDRRTRALLQRTETLAPRQLQELHGTMRGGNGP